MHEAAPARFLGGDRGRAASLGARGVFRNFASHRLLAVFSDFAAGGLLAGSNAVSQACAEAFDVVAHADRAGNGAALQKGAGQSGRFLSSFLVAYLDVEYSAILQPAVLQVATKLVRLVPKHLML